MARAAMMSVMNGSPNTSPKQAKIVMWVIWFAILQGLFIIRIFAAPKAAAPEEALPLELTAIAYVGITAAAISMIIRWLVIPKFTDFQSASLTKLQSILPLMIIGLAMAEGCGILSMFVIPSTHVDERNLLFAISVACVILSAPVYLLAKPEKSPFRES